MFSVHTSDEWSLVESKDRKLSITVTCETAIGSLEKIRSSKFFSAGGEVYIFRYACDEGLVRSGVRATDARPLHFW